MREVLCVGSTISGSGRCQEIVESSTRDMRSGAIQATPPMVKTDRWPQGVPAVGEILE